LGWWLYGRRPIQQKDPLEKLPAELFVLLRHKYFVDEIYERSVIRLNAWWAKASAWLDSRIWNGGVQVAAYLVLGLSALNRIIDDYVVNWSFDEVCRRITQGSKLGARLQDGRVQHYLRVLGVALTVLALLLIWGCKQ
jgi:NADH:ubiquinone oxidoreductase subunit 5 (subunit L)/multisubunit Na+/H+ antiporter MnhA subunit